jgi:hypothetical protein
MLLEMVVNKHVDFCQLVNYAWHWVVLHRSSFCFAT